MNVSFMYNILFFFSNKSKKKKKKTENHFGWTHIMQILNAALLKEYVNILRHIPGYYPFVCGCRDGEWIVYF